MGKAGKAAAATAAKEDGNAAAKKAGGAGKENVPPDASAAKTKTKGKAAKAAKAAEAEPSFLSRFRPSPRPIFFAVFVVLCASIVALYDPCDIKGKKKDCGYSGISPNSCRTAACFIKGGGGPLKKTVKVSRESGSKLGLSLAEDASGKQLLVKEVLDGSVRQHNSKLAPNAEEVIVPGDKIIKVSGSSSTASIKKAMEDTKEKTVEIEIQRSRLPSFLQWVQNPAGKPNMVEKLLTSPGSAHFGKTWLTIAKLALPCWFISGYPLASVPAYMTLSAGVSFYLSRCCHDETVGGGVPHCFKSSRAPIEEVATEVWSQAKAWADKVQKNPRKYVEDLFLPKKWW